MQRFKRTIYVFPGVLLALVLVLALFASPVAAEDELPRSIGPIEESKASCTSQGYDLGFKINLSPNGTFAIVPSGDAFELIGWPNNIGDPNNFITILNSDTYTFDWTSTIGIDAVIVKGGSEPNPDDPDNKIFGYIYYYQSSDGLVGLESFGDTDLEAVPGQEISHIEFCFDYELEVEKDAAGSYDRTITWELDKFVSPADHIGFIGDEFTSTWTVEATKTVVEDNYQVTGDIVISNPSPFDVDFTISDLIDGSIAATVTCPSSTILGSTLEGPGTLTCSYVAGDADGVDGDETLNVVTVTSAYAWVDGGTDDATISFTANVIGDEFVTINDDRAPDGKFPAVADQEGTTSFTYEEDFTCSTDASSYDADGFRTDNYPNKATAHGIGGTYHEATADVDVDCYIWDVSKTADGTWNNRYRWEITKTVDPESQSGFAGDTLTWKWMISWESFLVGEENHAVEGIITVNNPAPISLTVDVADVLTGDFPATVDCDGDTSLTVDPNSSGTCSYTAAPSSRLAENTATATRNSYSFSDTVSVTWVQQDDTGKDISIDDSSDVVIPTDQGFYYEYTETVECDADTSQYVDGGVSYSGEADNTATITWDIASHSDSAHTDYTCYIPTIEKTAAGTYDETHVWDVTKTVNPTGQSGFAGDLLSWTWTVTVDETVTESNFDMGGTITVHNPNGEDALVVALSDVLSDGNAVVIDPTSCNYDGTYLTVATGGTEICSYAANDLPYSDNANAAASNTATISLNNIDYSYTDPIEWVVHVIDGDALLTDNQVPLNKALEGHSQAGDYDHGPFEYSDEHLCSDDMSLYGEDNQYGDTLLNVATVTGSDGQSNNDDASTTYTCYIPTIEKTAAGTYDETHVWDVTKTVNPTGQSGFAGDLLSWTWTVTVDETVTESNFDMGGTITVHNPNGEDTLVVALSDVLSDGNAVVIDPTSCNYDGTYLTVATGGTEICSYAANDLPYSDNANAAASNTATISLNNIDYSYTDPIEWVVHVIDGDALLTDNQVPLNKALEGHSQAGDYDHGPFEYSDEHLCSDDMSLYGEDNQYGDTLLNIATVTGSDGQSNNDDASTTYTCYIPTIEKTAAGTYDETHVWDVTKTVNPTGQSGFAGDLLSWTWTVTVDETVTESNFDMGGTITVHNPNGEDALVVALSDVLSDGNAVIIDPTSCNYDGTYLTVATGGTEICSYAANDLPYSDNANAAASNTATISLNNIDYSYTDPIEWVVHVIDGDALLTDNQAPLNKALEGHSQAGDYDHGPFVYSDEHLCSDDMSLYSEDNQYGDTLLNVATVTGSDGQSNNDDASTTYTCYIPTISKTAEGTYDETHTWEITKTVEPESQSGFAGDLMEWMWIINVSEDFTETNFDVAGTITVNNPNTEDDLLVTLSDILGDGTVANITSCSGEGVSYVAGTLTVPKSETAVCDYEANDLGYTALVDVPTENTATITLNDIDYSYTDPIEWYKTVYNGGAVVDDEQFPTFPETLYAGDGPWTWVYPDEELCSTAKGAYQDGGSYSVARYNDATVTGDSGQYDEASADTIYTCYIPTIEKTAAGTYDETHIWDVTKTVNPPSQSGFANDLLSWTWTVTVDETVTESNFDVIGTITVGNPNDEDTLTVWIDDVLSDGTSANITSCSGEGVSYIGNTLSVPPSGTAVCNYSADDLDYADDALAPNKNTASIMLNGIFYYAEYPIEWDVKVIDGDALLTDDQAPLNVSLPGNNQAGTYKSSFSYSDSHLCSDDMSLYGEDNQYGDTLLNVATVTGSDGQSNNDDASTTYTCYIWDVSKTADGTYDNRYRWEITKTVDPLSQSGFAGDTLEWTWIISWKSFFVGEENHDVTGVITVTNPADIPLTVDVADVLTGDFPAIVDCDGDTSLTVDPNSFGTCNYSADDVGEQLAENTATATRKGISISDTVLVDWEHAGDTGLDASISDSNYGDIPLDAEKPYSYTESVECDVDTSKYVDDGVSYSGSADNEATITWDIASHSDSAHTDYTCYIPTISKTTVGTYDETHTWTIEKSVNPLSQSGHPGDVLPWTWTVDVNESSVDGNFDLFGVLTLVNPNPEDVLQVQLADVVDGGWAVAIAPNDTSCKVSLVDGILVWTVDPNGTGSCNYQSLDLPYTDVDEAPTYNKVSIMLNDIIYSHTEPIDWQVTVYNGTADLSDGQIGLSETLNAGEGSWTRTGDDSHTCSSNWVDYGADGTYGATVDNIAYLTPSDSSTQEAPASTTWLCEAGRIELTKTFVGNPLTTQTYTFQLSDATGVIATEDATSLDSTLFDSIALVPGTYTVCELVGGPGIGVDWTVDGLSVPDADVTMTETTICIDVTVAVSQTVGVHADNVPEGGPARTPGYWKNWASCSNSESQWEQRQSVAERNEYVTLDDALASLMTDYGVPLMIGDAEIWNCEDAVALLDRRNLKSDQKMGGSTLWGLASHLMAYHLNQAANHYYSAEAEAAAIAAQELLEDAKFNGESRIKNKDEQAYAAEAGALLAILDAYNNNDL